jgi:hypothetical protein
MATDVEVKSHQKLLYAAIDDIGEAVRGNDAKAYAALVLHGLILTGLTTLVSALGPVYQSATFVERLLGVGSLAVTFLCFMRSAWALIEAVTPYHPERLENDIKRFYNHVFFPTDAYTALSPHGTMTSRLEGMSEVHVRDELVAETLKLGDILKHESQYTARGYEILRYELCAAAVFIVVVAVSAL